MAGILFFKDLMTQQLVFITVVVSSPINMNTEEVRRRIKDSKQQDSEVLNLDGLDLTDDDLAQIFQNNSIFESNLRILYLQNNQLKSIKIQKFQNLETLSISNNQLIELPQEISELKKLKYLFIDYIPLRNSTEIILGLKDLEIAVWGGNNYSQVSSNILSIFSEPNQIKSIKHKMAKVGVEIIIDEEKKRHLDILAQRLMIFTIVNILLSLFGLIMFNWSRIIENWWLLAPLIVIMTGLVLTIFTLILGMGIGEWIIESITLFFEKCIYKVSGFVRKDYEGRKSDYDAFEAELDRFEKKRLNDTEIYPYWEAHKNKALLESSHDDKQHLIDSEIKSDDENQKI